MNALLRLKPFPILGTKPITTRWHTCDGRRGRVRVQPRVPPEGVCRAWQLRLRLQRLQIGHRPRRQWALQALRDQVARRGGGGRQCEAAPTLHPALLVLCEVGHSRSEAAVVRVVTCTLIDHHNAWRTSVIQLK